MPSARREPLRFARRTAEHRRSLNLSADSGTDAEPARAPATERHQGAIARPSSSSRRGSAREEATGHRDALERRSAGWSGSHPLFSLSAQGGLHPKMRHIETERELMDASNA